MECKCAIRGETYSESEGILWKQLRPSVQDFLKTFKSDWKDNYFISYNALNDLLRAYIANLTSEEVKAHQALAKKVEERFEKEDILKPLIPDLDGPKLSFGDRMADRLANFGGSWVFIISFMTVLVTWIIANSIYLNHANHKPFDPYPFILLNLVLSCIAAIQAPVIMMSQNRQESKDRSRSEYDFKVNLKAETEIRLLHEKIDHLLLHQHQNM